MSEGPDGGSPIQLSVSVFTPDNQRFRVSVPLDVTVASFVHKTMTRHGQGDRSDYRLQVPVPDAQGESTWHLVEANERLLDALRGVQHSPRIINSNQLRET